MNVREVGGLDRCAIELPASSGPAASHPVEWRRRVTEAILGLVDQGFVGTSVHLDRSAKRAFLYLGRS